MGWELQCTLPGHITSPQRSFTADGKLVATTSLDHRVFVCDPRTGKVLEETWDEGYVAIAELSKSAKRLMLASPTFRWSRSALLQSERGRRETERRQGSGMVRIWDFEADEETAAV